jgi:hypothetical protein
VQIRFVRTAGQPDRVYVRRDDGSEVSWAFPNFGEGLPHDLVHLVVETHFKVRHGFWGRVADGIDPARVNAEASRLGGAKDKYAGFGADQRELLLAEALAGMAWGVAGISDDDRLQLARDAAAKMGIDLPADVTAGALAEVLVRLRELGAKWRTLVPKGTLELTW